MKSVYQVRRDNLRGITSQWGGPTSLSKKLGHSNGSYLAQLIGPHPTREISEKVAREVERKLSLPIGWLDQEQNGAPTVDDESLAQCVRAVAAAIRDAGLKVDPDKYGTMVALTYDHWRAVGKLDENYIRKLTELMR